MIIPKKFTPHEYQMRGIQHMVSPQGGGAFLKPGMGKTSMTLAVYKILRNKNLVRKMLIVAPLRVAQLVWPEEIEGWLDFCDFKYKVLHGPLKDQRLKEDADIYITNYESLEWLVPKIASGEAKFDVLVIDESSKMRNTAGKRYKLLKKVLPKFSRRYILTGTPQPKSLLNLFGQIYIADLGRSLGKYITQFRAEFFYQKPGNIYDYFPFPDSEEKIYSRIQHMIFHLSDKDYLELPETTEVDIEVELSPKARKLYRQMERDYFLQLDKGVITAANAAVASGKLRQLCNGAVYTDAQGSYEILDDAKIQAYQDLLEELNGEPAIVVYNFESDYERMQAVAPGVKFTGAKNPEEIKAKWDKGEIPILYIHPKSAGYGLNMQNGGCTMIWYGLTFDYEDYAQTNKRLDRQGQTKPVTIYRLVTKNTLEKSVMLPQLAIREAGQERLFDSLKKFWENNKTEICSGNEL